MTDELGKTRNTKSSMPTLKARTKFMWRQEWDDGKQVEDLGLRYLKQPFTIWSDSDYCGRSTNTLDLLFTGLSNCCCRAWKRKVQKVALGHHTAALEWRRRSMLWSALSRAHTVKLEGMGPHRIHREDRERARTLGLLTGRGERSPESVPLGICCNMFWQMFRGRTLWFRKIFF